MKRLKHGKFIGVITLVLSLCSFRNPESTVSMEVGIGAIDNRLNTTLTTIPAIDISGIVSDEEGTPLIGVNIQIKGANTGTATDFDGRFTLPDVNEDAVLVVSYIGYQTQEVPLDGQTNLTIVLMSDSELLEEVVVVGYGTQKKVNVIGSVSQITAEKLENRPVTELSQAITGQMPGVTVIQRSGRPGSSGGEIRVRGVGSFGATPNALVLIDGIPGSLNELNPDNIQSISVLKDASSAAIYGARSANGVILVTTKNGTASKLSVGYNGYVGFNQATELPDFVDSWDFAAMYNIASGSNSFTEDDIAKYRSQSDPDNYPNTKFMEKIFSRNGVQTGHTLTVTGGNQDNKYYLSGGYLNQNGIIERNNYSRYNIRLNVENNFTDNLKLNTRLFGSFEERNEPQATANKGGNLINQLVQNAIRYPAIHLGQASNGDYGVGPETGGTPISWIDSKSYLINPQTRAGINLKLDWNPIDDLTFSAVGGYNFALLEQRSYLASMRLNDEVYHAQSYLDQFSNKVIFKTMQLIGEYSKSVSSNQFDLLAGYSFEHQLNTNFNGYRQDFPSNDYTVIGMGGADNQQAGGSDTEWAIQSLFSRFRYNFDERYLFEATVRYDGSSRFPESKKYALFPSMALGWRLTEEAFMNDVNWMTNLKLKASWGILGNQNIGNYPYQAVLNSGRNYAFGGAIQTGAAYSTYKDANIQWESTETTDFGIESEFFDGKITFNATYFNRKTEDILFQPSASVSSVLGVGISETNTGAAKNTGWEFELGHRNHVSDFAYYFNGNFSIINNEVITLGLGNVEQPNGFIGNGSSLFIGYPMQMYYGYLSDGVFTSEADIENWPAQIKVTPRPQPGDVRYQDISGPDGVPDGQVDPTFDRTYLGSRIPKYTFGANLGFSFKGLDMAAFLQGVAGVKGRLTGYAGSAFFNLGNIQKWQMEGRFDPENPTRYPDYPRLEVITNSGTPNTELSDFWVLNASYLRLKNVQLGYSLPQSLLQRIGSQNLRLYVSAENVLSLNNYRQGWDPEVNTGGAYYPILSTFTFGINLKF